MQSISEQVFVDTGRILFYLLEKTRNVIINVWRRTFRVAEGFSVESQHRAYSI